MSFNISKNRAAKFALQEKELVQDYEEREMKLAQEREDSIKKFLATPTPRLPEYWSIGVMERR